MRRVFLLGFTAGILLTAIVGSVLFVSLLQGGLQAHLDAEVVASQVEQQVLDAGHSQVQKMNLVLRDELPGQVMQITVEGFREAMEVLYGDQLQLPEQVIRPVEQHVEDYLAEELGDYLAAADFEPLLQELARQSRSKTYTLLLQGEGMNMEISFMDRWTVPVELEIYGSR